MVGSVRCEENHLSSNERDVRCVNRHQIHGDATRDGLNNIVPYDVWL